MKGFSAAGLTLVNCHFELNATSGLSSSNGGGIAAQDVIDDFELLKSESYLWGSPEWLEMRRRLMESDGQKGWSVRNQRKTFNSLRKTGLEYLF